MAGAPAPAHAGAAGARGSSRGPRLDAASSPVGGDGGRGPRAERSGGFGPRRGAGQGRDAFEAAGPLTCEPALEEEMGPQWHCGGARRWLWMHDGSRVNGWVEFGRGGLLTTSFGKGRNSGSWERRSSGEMVATFGKCHHVLELLPADEGRAPGFVLAERAMKDGSALRDRRPSRTCGLLDVGRPRMAQPG
uniref:Uncharacterized protein n=1 Tax=Alexandrium catenella TaxID=2925 RepID=A0A7S1PQL7_ALECA